jgi:hypothetical protein
MWARIVAARWSAGQWVAGMEVMITIACYSEICDRWHFFRIIRVYHNRSRRRSCLWLFVVVCVALQRKYVECVDSE